MAQLQNDPKESQKPAKGIEGMINGRVNKELKEISGKGQKAYTYETEAEELKNAERIAVPADAVETRGRLPGSGFSRRGSPR